MGLQPLPLPSVSEKPAIINLSANHHGKVIQTPEDMKWMSYRSKYREPILNRICQRARKSIKAEFFKTFGKDCIVIVDAITNEKLNYTKYDIELYCPEPTREMNKWFKTVVETVFEDIDEEEYEDRYGSEE